jgi:uncharacterized repeat protein (TIGR03803 family)
MGLRASAAQTMSVSCTNLISFKANGPKPSCITLRARRTVAFQGGSLVMDSAGNLYGVTGGGGTGHCGNGGCGTVYKLDTSGNEIVLHSFLFLAGNDGAAPNGGLALDGQDNLYGTTEYGGAAGRFTRGNGLGIVFKVDQSGNETVLYEFCPSVTPCPDGATPLAGVILDDSGNLYGTTSRGGAHAGKGTVFMLDTAGHESVLYSFRKTSESGEAPRAPVVLDAQGNLYGTTYLGGDLKTNGCCGTVFDLLTPASATATTLSSSPNPSLSGQAVTFTAVVTSGSGTPGNGETVSFIKGKTVLGTGTLSNGSSSFTISTLKVGTTSVAAVYGGDSRFSGSTSNTVKQVVKKGAK